MKIVPSLLLASIAANVALLALFFLRTSPIPQADRSATITLPTRSGAAPRDNSDAAALQAALASGDSAALAAAGVPSEVARTLAIGRAFERMLARNRALQGAATIDNLKYWRRNRQMETPTKEQRAEQIKAQREFSEAMRAAIGEDVESVFNGQETRLAFLPEEKRRQLRQIEEDYSELQQLTYAEQEGVQLPSDREKIRLLNLEKERDIAAALTPEEREQYELRVSQTANTLRYSYGDAIRSEEEYRRVFAIQKAFDDQYNSPAARLALESLPPSPEAIRSFRDAEQKLHEDIRAALDPARFATFQRENDADFKTLAAVARRLNLPATTSDVVLASRDSYAAQSMQINANSALSAEERRKQLQTLATAAQTELQGSLGVEGAQAYAQRSPWINTLKGGTAFSTNPKDAPAGPRPPGTMVFPVQPPRNPPVPAAAAPQKG